MLTIIIDIIVLILLVLMSALFSSSETALTTITPHRLRSMVDEQLKHADKLEHILQNKEKMLSVILICNNIVNIAASALCTVFVQKIFGSWAVSIGTGVLTLVILVIGEIAPKTIATYRAEQLSLKVCPIIYILMIVFTPIAAAVNFLASGVIKMTGVTKADKTESYTENEIRSIVEVSSEEGVIEDEEKELINNVFDFGDTIAREVMVPRINVTSVSIDSTYDEIKSLFKDYYYTRFPVLDADGNSFAGMLNAKDFIFMNPDESRIFQVRNYMRPLPYTFEQKHLQELFLEMKNLQVNMMAVMDEYGDTVGVITMEDLLEELVGDIRDEYDTDEEEEFRKLSDTDYEIPGSMGLSDINDRLHTDLQSDSYDSAGGIIMEYLDRLPSEGDSVIIGNTQLTVNKMDGTKIERIKLHLIQEDQTGRS